MIDVTGVDLVKLVKQAYALSVPRGLGQLHYEPDVLSDADARDLIARSQSDSIAVSLDYVRGRGVKLVVFRREGGRLEIQDAWYDHTTEHLVTLLECVGHLYAPNVDAAHNVSCECSACARQRRERDARSSVREDGGVTDTKDAGSQR